MPKKSASIRAASSTLSKPPAIRSFARARMPMRSPANCAKAFHARSTGVEVMSGHEDWRDRFVDKLDRIFGALPQKSAFHFLATHILVPFWAWRTSVKKQPGGPPFSVQPGDNLQRMMNLVMPLKDKSPIGRAVAALAIAQNKDEIYAGLDNVGTVHFARFVIVDDNICMFSVYDGDFTNYIRDFIATIGSVFDAVVGLVEGVEDVIPSEENVEKFIDWVHAHDLYQVPDTATDVLRDQE